MLIFRTKPTYPANIAGGVEVPLPTLLLILINVGMRGHSSHWTFEGIGTTDVPKQSCVPWSYVHTHDIPLFEEWTQS